MKKTLLEKINELKKDFATYYEVVFYAHKVWTDSKKEIEYEECLEVFVKINDAIKYMNNISFDFLSQKYGEENMTRLESHTGLVEICICINIITYNQNTSSYEIEKIDRRVQGINKHLFLSFGNQIED